VTVQGARPASKPKLLTVLQDMVAGISVTERLFVVSVSIETDEEGGWFK
jgi:hypothetical protein